MRELSVPELVKRTSSGIVYITDDALFNACGVRVAFSGRAGGVSKPPYDSLNMGGHVGDDPDAVAENRKRLLAALDTPDDCQVLIPNQVHGTHVERIDDAGAARIAAVRASLAEGADGIIVTVPAVAAMLCFADCVPLVMVAPDGTFAVVHAGWRGVMGKIALTALSQLAASSPSITAQDINVYIGPHIHAECFEVSEDLASRFGDVFGSDVVPDARHVDLLAALRVTLVQQGVCPERIADADICTRCAHDEFYSYRAAEGVCGRHAAVAFRRR